MVTRETSITEGLAAIGGLQADAATVRRLADLGDLLATEGVTRGLLGPQEAQRVVPRHILEAAALSTVLPQKCRIADVGSGAGLPGLVLAILGHDVVLIEAQRRRADFLRRAASELGVGAEVVQERAEDVGRNKLREAFGAVTARALAAPPVALELCLPLAAIGGAVAILATPNEISSGTIATGAAASQPHRSRSSVEADETRLPSDSPPVKSGDVPDAAAGRASADGAGIDDPASTTSGRTMHGSSRFRQPDASERGPAGVDSNNIDVVSDLLGGSAIEWIPLAVPGADAPRWVMMVRKVRPTPERYPRRAGVPKKHPLGGDVASAR